MLGKECRLALDRALGRDAELRHIFLQHWLSTLPSAPICVIEKLDEHDLYLRSFLNFNSHFKARYAFKIAKKRLKEKASPISPTSQATVGLHKLGLTQRRLIRDMLN